MRRYLKRENQELSSMDSERSSRFVQLTFSRAASMLFAF